MGVWYPASQRSPSAYAASDDSMYAWTRYLTHTLNHRVEMSLKREFPVSAKEFDMAGGVIAGVNPESWLPFIRQQRQRDLTPAYDLTLTSIWKVFNTDYFPTSTDHDGIPPRGWTVTIANTQFEPLYLASIRWIDNV